MAQEAASRHNDRLINALAGGWVADAASLGLHWLYDSPRIAEVAGNQPEFLEPRGDYFDGVFGYFAHGGKKAGDTSHYAAATRVLTDSLLANQGALSIRDYQRRFRTYFGPGGGWQGFLDNPTRITLENLTSLEHRAIDKALATVNVDLSDKQRRVLVQKVLPYTRHLSGADLAGPVREAVNLTYKEPEIQQAGVHLAETIDRNLAPESGADDTQLPAVSKLAPLVACYLGQDDLLQVAEAAVRVTNHSDEAVAWARCAATLLNQLFLGESVSSAMDAAMPLAPDVTRLEQARSGASLNGPEAGDTFGRTCYLYEAMPVIFHILSQANSFVEAARSNIQCGGDSCGRSWIIGPAMAAIHGVGGETGIPLSWLTRVTDSTSILRDIESLVRYR
ncbi:ADP-ribosylglycohydrolase family protein [Marinobacter sp. CHS3-4]|uniref:ADP-ribosylglycohydrolase family protein n=1 Tax=Marinobacter sp. CHS3-4 TaxID=3045174 RepID=UPI0024B5DCC5|nr:ADP-ribosylglycohydrolase family protein [Marinobacter sp. CHS3-4]MDI9243681.1 ADP-ribosylglycohydrolase family protein [Marinobacter sp. CHS3-4]